MGKLVPYGQVWRTGADDATSFKTPIDLDIGGIMVPAGSYTIYTLPAEGTWKLIINKQTGQWGTEYNQAQDLARIDLIKTPLPKPMEEFTIEFEKKSPDAAIFSLNGRPLSYRYQYGLKRMPAISGRKWLKLID